MCETIIMSCFVKRMLPFTGVAAACLGLLSHFAVPIFHECDVVSYWYTGATPAGAKHGGHSSHGAHAARKSHHAEQPVQHDCHGTEKQTKQHNHDDCVLCQNFIQLTLLSDFSVYHQVSVLFQLDYDSDFQFVSTSVGGSYNASTPVRGPPRT